MYFMFVWFNWNRLKGTEFFTWIFPYLHPWLVVLVRLYKLLWDSFLCVSVMKWRENAELGTKIKWTMDLELWLESLNFLWFDLACHIYTLWYGEENGRKHTNTQTNKKHLCSSWSFWPETKKLRENKP